MNEIEEKFYKTFGIEPKHYDGCKQADKYWNDETLANEFGTFDNFMRIKCPMKYQVCTDECKFAYDKKVYSELTDRILLELICLLNSIDEPPYAITVNELKEDALIGAINTLHRCETKEWLDNFKKQVQSLFTGEGEEC